MTRLSPEGAKVGVTSLQMPENSRDISPKSQPVSGSASDNDTSERSAREKLKKASLASLGMSAEERSTKESEGHSSRSISNSEVTKIDATDASAVKEVTRGRPLRKRSYEDFEGSGTDVEDTARAGANGHTRKKSQDVHSRGSSKGEGSPQPDTTDIVKEASEDKATTSQVPFAGAAGTMYGTPPSIAAVGAGGSCRNNGAKSLSVGGNGEQLGMNVDSIMCNFGADRQTESGTVSPRKKRSRDQFDTEIDREQKIAATEEARALRLSSEIDREEMIIGSGETTPPPRTSKNIERSDVEPSKNIFGSSSRLGSLAAPSKVAASLSTPSDVKITSQSAFASSGFAALANSATSPFTKIEGPSSSVTNSFATAARDVGATPSNESLASPAASVSAISGFGSFSNPAASTTRRNGMPSHDETAPAKPGFFGGAVFGGGFGAGFGSGHKLSSFAAPTGDARLKGSSGAVKPIGSLEDRNEEERNNLSDDESDQENCEDVGTREADERFQHQNVDTGEDGEDSLFASRASLYSFKNNAWKENGKGVFKFNVTAPSGDQGSTTTGRFIMRAHQTFRLLLNAPIFKQMKVGDSKGNEPSGKSFAFAVIEDGKPTPYMVKLADVGESRTLYHAVQKLQHEIN